MSVFLSPAIGVMNRLSVQGKLALLGLVAMVPVVVLAFMLLERINNDIAFSDKETHTVSLVMPARDLMQAVQPIAGSPERHWWRPFPLAPLGRSAGEGRSGGQGW
jgi:hypothetical protein